MLVESLHLLPVASELCSPPNCTAQCLQHLHLVRWQGLLRCMFALHLCDQASISRS
jgi:hypothetical protein